MYKTKNGLRQESRSVMNGLVAMGGGLMVVKLWRIEQDLWSSRTGLDCWQHILIYCVYY